LGLSTSWLVGLCLILLGLSFLFSGTETAFFSLQKLDKQRLLKSGSTGQRVLKLLKRRAALITTLLIGNETVNVTLAATGAELFNTFTNSPTLNSWLNILIITPTLVLLSEITPKVLAFRFNRQWAKLAIWPLSMFFIVVTVPRIFVQALVSGMSRLFGASDKETGAGLGEEELMSLIDLGAAAGTVDSREREMIESVLEFDELTVGRLMTPRPDIFSIPLSEGWTGLLAGIQETRFSRIPLYDRGKEDIVGVLLRKDMLKHQRSPPAGPRQLRSLLMPPVFIPQSKPATDLLQEFLRQRNHIAFVVDEHGTLVGLVTLDDLLEELFGDIPDDDSEEPDVVPQGPSGLFVVNAGLDVEDFEETTGLALPEGDYHTVGGFVFHELGRLPRRGDRVFWEENRFVVRKMDGRRIASLQVKLAVKDDTDQEVSL